MNERSFYGAVWGPVYLVTQVVAFFVVLALDPAGFDACEATPSSGTRVAQALVAGLAVVAPATLAAWRLRGGLLAAALVPTAFTGLAWVWLIFGGPQSC